jgi:hypothetical protein
LPSRFLASLSLQVAQDDDGAILVCQAAQLNEFWRGVHNRTSARGRGKKTNKEESGIGGWPGFFLDRPAVPG